MVDKALTPEKQALNRAAELLGGQVGVATACDYDDRRHVWPWFNTERPVPPDKCACLERATGGQVLCEQLRPDLAWTRVKDRAWIWHPKGRPVLEVAPVEAARGR